MARTHAIIVSLANFAQRCHPVVKMTKPCLLITLWLPLFACTTLAAEKPNVLFLAVDDLRPELTAYGAEKMVTPNFDRLAQRGVRFDRAYCMVPTCGASRASLMTGLRPARDRFVTFDCRADEDAPGIVPLNAHFKNNGYTSLSLGKVFHSPADNASGWSEPPVMPSGPKYFSEEALAKSVEDKRGRKRGPSWENGGDVPDNIYIDGKIADEAIRTLERLASKPNQPFFFAVGFTKPHLPFVAPGRYFENYPESEITMPDNYFPPENAPESALHNYGELRSYSDIPARGSLPEDKALELIRAYYAATSYTDANIGRILRAFDNLGLSENTIIVLWGDHGWNLGEHTLWCKHSCFETSLRAPLIFATPDSMKLSSGESTTSLTEFIDIYPTLCELAGLELPDHLEGDSLLPVLRAPATAAKAHAISRFKNGDTIRTERFRYSLYTDKDGATTGHMLYDHETDPGENFNIADHPEYAQVVQTLARKLREGKGSPRDK